jgi:ubiquinone/menaquinone biosynthesis C-methylase UbiE
MRYDWRREIPFPPLSEEYFAEVDARFFASARRYMPWRELPFDREIPFGQLSDLDVLEIGVGQGSHAGLIAQRARSFTGIDITEPAVAATRARMQQLGLANAHIVQMDAEEMTFPDCSFDYIWSWGVIHHSADTRRVLEQMHRVLRPGGRANVMVYHRSFWKYYVFDGLFKGLAQGTLLKGRSLHDVNQVATDGAIARYYRKHEWRALAGDLFCIDGFRVRGLKVELIPLPAGRLKSTLERALPDGLTRFFTNTLEWGSFLTIHMTKISPGGGRPT